MLKGNLGKPNSKLGKYSLFERRVRVSRSNVVSTCTVLNWKQIDRHSGALLQTVQIFFKSVLSVKTK